MKQTSYLEDKWKSLFGENKNEVLEMLITAYSEPRRTYHNLLHIENMFMTIEKALPEFDQDIALNIAVWFHDYIYIPGSAKNEILSAQAAEEFCIKSKFSLEVISEVKDMILMGSKLGEKVLSPKTQIFHDLDYVILAGSPLQYAQYATGVKNELSFFVKNFIYRSRRIKFLIELMAQEKIFLSEKFQVNEKRARENIQHEIGISSNYKKWRSTQYAPVEIDETSINQYVIESTSKIQVKKFALNSIEKIQVSKRNLAVVDQLVLIIHGQEGLMITTEDALGGNELMRTLKDILPSSRPFSNWFLQVAFNSPSGSLTTIYNRDSIDSNSSASDDDYSKALLD
jgi:predicted metal-dependent HD superfamily phosphohydrolase